MIVATDKSFRPLGAIAPWTPVFEVVEMHLNGQLVNLQIFQNLGAGLWCHKVIGAEFEARGWMEGYDDHDAATPLFMARCWENRYHFMGVRW